MPRPKQFALVFTMAALCSAGVLAQNRPAAAAHGFSVTGGHHPAGITFADSLHRRTFRRNPYFYGAPYFNSDYEPYEPQYQAPPEPQSALVMQAKPEPVPDPVLLELRGGQWVRVTGFGAGSEQTAASISTSQVSPQEEQLPAVLVYRDGHSEEVSSYSIIGAVMYTKSDYWTSGAWSRTIKIADLDVTATLKKNQQRGVKFDLPSGPDEIILRP